MVAPSIGLCGLGVTSSIRKPHVTDMLQKFSQQVTKRTGRNAKKVWGMSDAEDAYKESMKEAFGCSTLDCYFHWVEAFRKWFGRHCNLSGAATLCLRTKQVQPDLERLHYSPRDKEFQTKVETTKRKWEELGITKATRWHDEQGVMHDISAYLDLKVKLTPSIHFGHGQVLPTTNNMTESLMRYTREDAGNVPAAMPPFVQFLIDQVEHPIDFGIFL